MHIINIENGRDGYVKILEHAIDHGFRRDPRGLVTFDAGPTTIVVHDIHNALPIGTGRGINPKIAAIEAIQLIGGISRPDMVVKASPSFEKYREPNGEFYGAYGRRIGDQVFYAIEKIKNDPETRQAVITLWNPLYDNVNNIKDYPCTVSLNFAVYNDKLNMNTLMRSNDAWLGTPYDIFQFTQLQWTVSRVLGIEPGKYTHTAWSLHVYENDLDKIEDLISSDIDAGNAFQPMGIGAHKNDWRDAQDIALNIVHGNYAFEKRDLSDSEAWYDRHISAIR